MHLPRQQCTIAKPCAVDGFGYWSGRDVRVEFRPAAVDAGVTFVRHDLERPARIPAMITHRVETPRRTTLRAAGVTVEMVEHVLAALAGLHIDNCEIWVNAAEMPGCDGSSQPFVAALLAAGVAVQSAPRAALIVQEVTRLGDVDSWIEARPTTADCLSLKFRIDYGATTAIGRQTLTLPINPDSFSRELAPSRTFLLKSEAEWLLAQGLGARTSQKDLLVFDHRGPIDNVLRFRDECVRHKALDLVGDLSLAGCDLIGHFVAHRSGHRLNAELVRVLLSEGEVMHGRRKSA